MVLVQFWAGIYRHKQFELIRKRAGHIYWAKPSRKYVGRPQPAHPSPSRSVGLITPPRGTPLSTLDSPLAITHFLSSSRSTAPTPHPPHRYRDRPLRRLSLTDGRCTDAPVLLLLLPPPIDRGAAHRRGMRAWIRAGRPPCPLSLLWLAEPRQGSPWQAPQSQGRGGGGPPPRVVLSRRGQPRRWRSASAGSGRRWSPPCSHGGGEALRTRWWSPAWSCCCR
jgi:hypothetical protein